MINDRGSNHQAGETKIFWSEIAPSEYIEPKELADIAFLDLLEGFITGGFSKGDCVLILVTEVHRVKLYERLYYHRVRLNEMLVNQQFIAIDAAETLEKFMVEGHPDENRFMDVVNKLISKAHRSGRPVRVFGEMVAHLWENGFTEATIELEGLWNKFCDREKLTLMRAYPGQGLSEDLSRPMMYIYGTHRNTQASEFKQKEIANTGGLLRRAV
jgi:hypothetical protein